MRTRTAFVAVALVVAAVAAVPASGLAATGGPVVADQHQNGTATNQTENANASVAPGERLSGVVGVQETELEGEVDQRAFGLQVARAATNNSKAEVVSEQFDAIQQRLDELQQRKQELNESRQNGTMSDGRYRAKIAQLAARTENVKEMANATENATKGLPTDLLESKGINVTAIQTLQKRASELAGPQVAKIARSIAGPGVGPGDRGPSERPGQGGAPEGKPGQGSDGGQNGPPADAGPNNGGQQGGTATPTGTPTPTPTSTPTASGDGGSGNASGQASNAGGR